jgi:CheY-like chemotaxis protein
MNNTSVGIVEDEGIVALDLIKSLKVSGYKVLFSVDSGESALEKLKFLKPDIILMDVYLKGSEDGIQTAQIVDELYGIPIIFLTAYNEDVFDNSVIKPKRYKFIKKPYEYLSLQASMEELLSKAKV